MIYQIGLLLIQFCLFWRYFGKGRWSGLIIWTVLLFSAFIYFYGLFIDTLYLADRLWFLSRDFLVIGGSAVLFFISLKWGKFLIPALLVLTFSTLFLHYYLPGKFTLQSLHLHEKAEVLLLVNPKTFKTEQVNSLNGVQNIQDAFLPFDKEITELDEYVKIDVKVESYQEWKVLLKNLKKIKGVIYLEPNFSYALNLPKNELSDNPEVNPPLTKDPLSGNQWALKKLDILGLNQLMANSKVSVKKKGLLAILDTGIDQQHEDILGHYKSISSGADLDPKGHGTHCAGIASAMTNNNIGIASLNYGEGLFYVTSIRVLNAAGYGTKESIVDGIIEAVDKGATVISLSLGGPGNPLHQRVYKKAVSYAASKGTIIVVAAGNSNRNAREFSPANVKGVITVAAVDVNLSKASFSNKVMDIKMAVSAPGVNILSTLPHNQYGILSGTSMATPYVASIVTILKVINPRLTAQEIHSILQETGSETKDTRVTGKFIQPKMAFENILK